MQYRLDLYYEGFPSWALEFTSSQGFYTHVFLAFAFIFGWLYCSLFHVSGSLLPLQSIFLEFYIFYLQKSEVVSVFLVELD